MSDGFFHLVGLLGAIANGPSNAGERKDGKICTAQAGECRFNHRYYSLGMRDAKSWSMPCADETCPDRCPYLRGDERYLGTEQERRKLANGMIEAIDDHQRGKRAMGALALGMMGIDPREVLEED
jgi:hypothetical protein